MIRNALTVLLALALAGCGFHLRDSLALPEDTPPVQVVSTTPFSELATILERNLRNAGAPVVTREQVPGALHARITGLIDSGELERAAGLALDPAHSRVMICGNPQMIEDTRACLKQRDMQLAMTRRPGQIAVENYW